MENEYQLRRHTELWENQNRQIRRIIFVGILFSYIAYVNILNPYDISVTNLQNELNASITKKDSLVDIKAEFIGLKEVLSHVNRFIEGELWVAEKDSLILAYQRLNRSGANVSWDTYQKKADSTVNSIGTMVLDSIQQPLSPFFEKGKIASRFSKLSKELDSLTTVVENWSAKYLGYKWYITVEQKGATLQFLTEDLNEQIDQVNREVIALQDQINRDIEGLENQLISIMDQIEEEQKKLQNNLDEEMSKILPSWISGIITVEQIMLYPFIIIGIVLSVFILAMTMSRHYHHMMKGLKISIESNSDPALSSLWTLTDRGRFGTFLTITTYSLFVLFMWYFFEQGYIIFSNWQLEKPDGPTSDLILNIALWFCRFILFSTLSAFVLSPMFKGRIKRWMRGNDESS